MLNDLWLTIWCNLNSTTNDKSFGNGEALAGWYLKDAHRKSGQQESDPLTTQEVPSQAAAALPTGSDQNYKANELKSCKAGWATECQREIIVRKRKYWWVGPSILFATLGVSMMLSGVIAAVIVINDNLSRNATPVRAVTVQIPAQQFTVKVSAP